jgi:hypothetical protein
MINKINKEKRRSMNAPNQSNMINKIDKERRHSMNAAPTRPSNKRQRQGAQEEATGSFQPEKYVEVMGEARHVYFL